MDQRPVQYPRRAILQLKPSTLQRGRGPSHPWQVPAFPGRTYAVARAAKPFLARMEYELKRPIANERVGRCYRVTVLGVIVFESDFAERRIRSGQRRPDGEIDWKDYCVEVFRPLRSRAFVEILAEHWGFAPDDQRDRASFLATVWRLVWTMPAFQMLRRVLLPRALAIPKPLMWLALQSRAPGTPRNSIVTNQMLNIVWKYRPAFQRLARENHQLMPLLMEAIQYGLDVGEGDAAHQLKGLMRNVGVAEREWRFLVRFGARHMRPIWVAHHLGNAWKSIAEYVAFIADATDRPPPARFVRLWLELEREQLLFDPDGHLLATPAWVRTLAIARSQDRDLDWSVFEDELFLVFRHYLDGCAKWKKSGKVTWRNLVDRADRWRCEKTTSPEIPPTTWESLVGESRIDGCWIVPITTERGLTRLGFEFHNCLAHNAKAYGNDDRLRIFHLATGTSRNQRAVACLKYDNGKDEWRVFQVSSFANRRPSGVVWSVASEIARRYTYCWRKRISSQGNS